MLKLDTLSMADAATILMRSGPATLCIWSRDDILRQASEPVIRETATGNGPAVGGG
ncbi:hypothetical protein [Escherichia coli]|uniref:hypothetical protein n=1 Tax=Escherichia coli TaxID=562 RepID=UPI00351573CB